MDSLLPFEIQISMMIQSLGNWLYLPMRAFSWLGSEQAFLILIPTLYWCVSPGLGLRIGVMLLATNSVNTVLKIGFHSPRPYWVDPQVQAFAHETSFGLPSGHSQTAASVWGLLSRMAKQRWLKYGLIFTIISIGFSRLYLGVHFTRDVLSGWLIGAFLVWLFTALEKPVITWFERTKLVQVWLVLWLCSILIFTTILGISTFTQNQFKIPDEWIKNAALIAPETPIHPFGFENGFTIAGTFFGISSGFGWLAKKNKLFTVHKNSLHPLYCLLVGIAGLLLLYLGLGAIFPREANWISYFARYLRYTLIGLWVSAAAPLLFLRLGWMSRYQSPQS